MAASWSVIAGEVPTTAKWNILGENDAEFASELDQLFDDKTMGVATDGATVEFDISARKLWSVTLGGNRTLQFSGVTIGRAFAIRLVQDGTGGRTVTWPTGIKWPSGSPPTLSPNPGAIDWFVFIPTASGQYDALFAGFGLE